MYRIALADHAFDKHSGIDPSHSVMRLCHVAQDALLRLACLGVDRDHLAARVTLEDGEAQPLPDLEGRSDVELRIIEQRKVNLPAHRGNVGLVEEELGGMAPALAELGL